MEKFRFLLSGSGGQGVITMAILLAEAAVLYERMPQLDGSRLFIATKREETDKQQEFSEYLARRRGQDQDMWLIEVDIADPERFVAGLNDSR